MLNFFRGPYPFVWTHIALFEHKKNNKRRPTSVVGAILKSPITGVDSSTSFTLTFEELQAQVSSIEYFLPRAIVP